MNLIYNKIYKNNNIHKYIIIMQIQKNKNNKILQIYKINK